MQTKRLNEASQNSTESFEERAQYIAASVLCRTFENKVDSAMELHLLERITNSILNLNGDA